jgi:prepilin peptidase CpaA
MFSHLALLPSNRRCNEVNLSFNTNGPILVAAVGLSLLAMYSDLRWRRIPNYLILPAVALGILLNFLGDGLSGMLQAFFGLVVGMSLLLLPYLLGGMGGGDVKLMGALGTLLGSHAILNVFLYTSLVGGVIAIVVAVSNQSLIETFKRIWLFLKCIFLFQAPSTGALVFKKSPTMPYGVAIGAGTLFYLVVGKII